MAKPKNRTAVATVALSTIVATGEAGMYVPQDQAAAFLAAGLVETNKDMMQGDMIMTRATPAGFAEVAKTPETPLNTGTQAVITTEQTEAVVEKVKPVFEIETDVELPVNKRAGRAEMYPFVEMEKGHSFFVPGKDPKSLASTVASAMNRYSVVDPNGATVKNRKGEDVPKMNRTREFVARAATKNGVNGTRIHRTS